MAGLTKQGLEIKRLNDIRSELRAEALDLFSDLLEEGEVLDTSSSSTIGRLIGLVSPLHADLWEGLLEVYSAFDPNSASGIALDNLVALAGIVRKGATRSTARALVSGSYGIEIPENSVVSSSYTNNNFETPVSVLLDENNAVGFSAKVQLVSDNTDYTVSYTDGTNTVDLTYTSQVNSTAQDIVLGLAEVINSNYGSILTATVDVDTLHVITKDLVTQNSYTLSSNLFFSEITKGVTLVATEFGPIEQEVGTIDTIKTPVFGWSSLQQIEPTVVGELRETDSMLRERFNESKYTRGSNILDALYADLISLSGVENITIYENTTNTTDSKGLPAHSFMVLIRGGLENEIAEAIWRNRPAGITTHGNSVYLIRDVFNNEKEVRFQRPTFVDIFISVTLTTDEDFPADGVERVKSALFNYIKTNADVGEEVVYSRLYTPLNSVLGHQVDELTLGFSENPVGTSNLTLDYDKIAKLEISNIEVTVT